jgi:succinate-acetate transporter protein
MIVFIVIFIIGVLFIYLSVNLIKTDGPIQKIKGFVGLIGGALGVLYSFLEIIFHSFLMI